MIIRPLTVFEREAVRKLYLSLSDDDRRMRFCASASDETLSTYVSGLDFTRSTLLGAFDERAGLIGVAELAHGATESEMAFAVRADMRGQKIGTLLMERLLVCAKMSGVRRVVVMFLSENTPMRKLALRAGMLIRADGSEMNASRDLQAPSVDELGRWLVEEGFAHGGYFSTLMIARWGSLLQSGMAARRAA
jgi:GNAT superfamily N-acetyltransferase